MKFNFNVHVHHHIGGDVFEITRLLRAIYNQGARIMSTQQEAAAQLAALRGQVVKATGEIKARIQALIDAAANAQNTDPALQAELDQLPPLIQALDDINPDAVEPPVDPNAPTE